MFCFSLMFKFRGAGFVRRKRGRNVECDHWAVYRWWSGLTEYATVMRHRKRGTSSSRLSCTRDTWPSIRTTTSCCCVSMKASSSTAECDRSVLILPSSSRTRPVTSLAGEGSTQTPTVRDVYPNNILFLTMFLILPHLRRPAPPMAGKKDFFC